MKTCCIIVVTKLRVVLQMCLQTISSVISIDDQLKPIVLVQLEKLFISNFQHFVHLAIRVSSSGKACIVKSIFTPATGTSA